jgi:hypothetical protein
MLFKKNKTRGGRLRGANLFDYLATEYGSGSHLICRNVVSKVSPVIQAEWGGANDCSLCSTMAIGAFHEGYSRSFDELYNDIVKVADKYFYSPNKFGTIPIFINNIIDRVFNVKSEKKYLKGIGFSWKTIKNNIDNGIPMILSVYNDGRNYYMNHSVVLVGYMEYSHGAQMLVVFDNWSKETSFIDYKKMSRISCLNYIG